MKLITFYFYFIFLWLRQIVFMIYLALLTIFFSLMTIFFGCFLKCSYNIKLSPVILWSKLLRWGMFIFLQLKTEIKGRVNISKTPCIYIVKHHSIWETLILYGVLKKVCFVFKQDLLKIPLVGLGLRCIGSLPIDRRKNIHSYKKTLYLSKFRVKSGLSIIIFPEGKRVSLDSSPKFHKTGVNISKINNIKIVPIAHNSGCFWPKNFGLIKPGKITLSIGDHIYPVDDVKKINDYCHQLINHEVRNLVHNVGHIVE